MHRHHVRPLALAVHLTCLLAAGSAWAQSTTGTLTGQAPADGTSIAIQSDTGLSREVPVDARGHYQIQQLPLGTYKVLLKRGDQVIETREDVVLTVNSNTDVSFASRTADLGTVTVTASRAAAAIDVGSVDSRTVITAQQLQRLPLQYSSEAIAQLAPGVVNNSAGYTGPTGQSLVSFGGSSASENAYYINGFNTTDPLSGLGGLTLPYGVIDQQEIFTGGFSAKYGRSAGGVINAIGKRGTNEWHFGGQYSWEPDGTRASQRDIHYTADGSLYQPSSQDRQTTVTRSVYASGPIIEDRLFFFGAYELEKVTGSSVGSVEDTNSYVDYQYDRPRWYGKLDWNITDSHLLELTGASSRNATRGSVYGYDYDALQRGDYVGADNVLKTGGTTWSAKYTGYLTDRLTISALYGKSDMDDYQGTPGYNADLIYLDGLSYQNPAYTGGGAIRNAQTTSITVDPDRHNESENLRLDVNYVIGNHNITLGIDNQRSNAFNRGEVASGPDGYYWEYGQTDPASPISSGLGVPATGGYANGEDGYYVVRHDYNYLASVESRQTAQYIEDNWQVTDNLLLNLGLRLDQFTNYNGNHDAYIKQTSGQWAPRLGFSWDVNGDASFKVFGNAGRYYLALPLNPAFGAAGAVLQTATYYTYGGIDANGYPTDLTAMSGAVSDLNYYGNLPDPRTVATQGIKPSFQDEFILGFSRALGSDWVYGAKATYRILRSGIDDYCDSETVFAKAATLGYDVDYDSNPVSCWLFNPGKNNTFTLVDTSGNDVSVPLSQSEMGMPDYKRNYYAVNLALEHPFNGTWYGKLDYTWSRSYGTSEGQLQSTIQQTAVSTTIDWDNAALMENTNGPQNNDHTHQLKLYGYVQLSPEWLASANLSLVSGVPKNTLGSYVDPNDPTNTDPTGYGTYYHFYQGAASPPGSQGRLPWTKQLDIGLSYTPTFADKRLKFSADVFNVFNSQTALWRYPYSELDPGTANPLYGAIVLRQAPRSLRVSVSYDY